MAEVTAAAATAAVRDEAGAPDAPACTLRALTHPSPVAVLRRRSFVLAWIACHQSSPTSRHALSECCHRSVHRALHRVAPLRTRSTRRVLRPRRPRRPHADRRARIALARLYGRLSQRGLRRVRDLLTHGLIDVSPDPHDQTSTRAALLADATRAFLGPGMRSAVPLLTDVVDHWPQRWRRALLRGPRGTKKKNHLYGHRYSEERLSRFLHSEALQ